MKTQVKFNKCRTYLKYFVTALLIVVRCTSWTLAQLEPNAGTWQTWVLSSGQELRLAPPPDAATTESELEQLQSLAAVRDEAALELIHYWDTGSPGFRWNELALQQALKNGIGGPRASRIMALLNVAIYDATVAAWDSKYAYNRPRPSAESSLETAIPTPSSPAYPSEHAVAAGAASTVLAYLFPDDAASFQAKAEEAGQSRLLAGTDYPSDVTAGLELGREVGNQIIAWAKQDGSDAQWTGSVPTEAGKWNGTKPAEPLAGTWQTWVLGSPDQFRPGPRAAYNSEQMVAELEELKTFERTNLTNITASYWEYYGGRAVFEFYTNQVSQKLLEHRSDTNPPLAARAYALQATALYDTFVACWDAKYAYWEVRPFQLDPTLTTVFTTPNHPSYPAAHASLAGAMETVMGYLFPRDAAYFTKIADDESMSRLWAGIHFRSDIEAGRSLGQQVGTTVVTWGEQDGSALTSALR
jgi:membrane-associated phospholipid phosphatase